jgi:hypothetical protein
MFAPLCRTRACCRVSRAARRTLYEKLSQLTSAPGEATTYVDLMLICQHFEFNGGNLLIGRNFLTKQESLKIRNGQKC